MTTPSDPAPCLPSYPPKPSPGDRIAVLSPSSGLPGLLPLPYELGLERLRKEYGLEPVEYPTTRKMGATPRERADDIHAAFADPTVKAVIASIGGDDQITVLPLLDRELIRANPKLTAESLRAALFTSGPYELRPAERFGDVNRPWQDPATFDSEPATEPGGGWIWHRPDRVVEARSWGGNIEILSWLLMADREIAHDTSVYDGQVLFLETSEDMPSANDVFWILRSMGERGLLQRFPALLMGRAKAWSFERPNDAEAKARYAREQREAVLKALGMYAPEMMVVFDVDFGHTDPQLVIPYGGTVRADGPARRITVTY
ncbi:S66 peptidase family protein [Streptomyces sp. R21]|uniref:S66 peptidase family protein n=1 Tax=Streptomyces sp. R21 TaxID=3238627 RepID=A0AB39PG54_9ACTN